MRLLYLVLLINFIFNSHFTKAQKRLSFDTIRLLNQINSDRVTIDLNFAVNINKKELYGDCSYDICSNFKSDSLKFKLSKNFIIDSILDNFNNILSYKHESNSLIIQLPGSNINKIRIKYHGYPIESTEPPWTSGFIWKTDSMNNPFIGVCCEKDGPEIWWPIYENWFNKICNVRVNIFVPNGLIAISNGKFMGNSIICDSIAKFSWYIMDPILPYNITMYIGKYEAIDDFICNNQDTLHLHYYVLSNNILFKKSHFNQIKLILKAYEFYFGEYPFTLTGFKIIEAPYLGMEHQTAIGYGNMFLNGYRGNDLSGINLPYDYILIHEIAHEWWGNSISAKTLNEIWIHESFATYSEALFVEYIYDYTTSLKYINFDLLYLTSNSQELCDTINGTNFGTNLYNRGSATLNTFRSIINNDQKWFLLLKGICTNYRFSTIESNDILNSLNRNSNFKFDIVFSQYVYNKSIPVLEIIVDTLNKDSIMVKYSDVVEGFDMQINWFYNNNVFYFSPNTTWKLISPKTGLLECLKLIRERFLIIIKIRYK